MSALVFARRHATGTVLAGLLALTVAMFGDVLFSSSARVLGDPATDLGSQFLAWRGWGFGELRAGNFPLWNPHIFSGAPFFGGMQAALLYPPNALFLFLPLAAAVNWSIALHVWAAGAFMALWMLRRGLRPAAAFFAGALLMFCGAHFSHIFAGHLPNLCAMPWVPLIFLAIDAFFEKREPRWCLLGMAAVGMQIFAGHPQYVFYTAIAAGLYSLLRLPGERRVWPLAAGLAGIYAGGAALAAVQLFTGAQATAETVRGRPLPLEFVAIFSFPPENFVTLLAPDFFGKMQAHDYWGRCALWEMSLFIGVTGLALVIYGVAFCERKKTLPLVAALLVMLLLALGAHTPLLALLYRWAPGFDKFRGLSKFIFPATLFLVTLSAMGMDSLLRTRRAARRAVVLAFAAAIAAGLAAIAVQFVYFGPVLRAMRASGESYLPPQLSGDFRFVASAKEGAFFSLLIASAALLALAGLFAWTRRNPSATYAILALGVVEVFAFARATRATFDSARAVPESVRHFLKQHPGDFRIANPLDPDSAMLLGANDVWGNDPAIVRRYAEFIAWTQGNDPDAATQNMGILAIDPLYALLRLRFALLPMADSLRVIEANAPPLPRLQLVTKYRVRETRDAIFSLLRERDLDPRGEVILEREPSPMSALPSPGAVPGSARIVEESSDALTLEADLAAPAILLITDVWTPAWRAVALPGSVQARYELQPADYILRAVPLAAGHHRFRVEYAPRAFLVGAWISVLSALGFLAALGVVLREKSRDA